MWVTHVAKIAKPDIHKQFWWDTVQTGEEIDNINTN